MSNFYLASVPPLPHTFKWNGPNTILHPPFKGKCQDTKAYFLGAIFLWQTTQLPHYVSVSKGYDSMKNVIGMTI